MLTAKDIMTTDPITVAPNTDIIQAAGIMLEGHFNGLPVVDDKGTLVGVICRTDLISQQKTLNLPSVFTLLDGFIPIMGSSDAMEKEMEKIAATSVSQAMTPDPVTVTPDTTIEEIATMMVDKKAHTLPVLDGGKLIGVIGKEDILLTLVPNADNK
jgi:CBS domain-containing protein